MLSALGTKFFLLLCPGSGSMIFSDNPVFLKIPPGSLSFSDFEPPQPRHHAHFDQPFFPFHCPFLWLLLVSASGGFHLPDSRRRLPRRSTKLWLQVPLHPPVPASTPLFLYMLSLPSTKPPTRSPPCPASSSKVSSTLLPCRMPWKENTAQQTSCLERHSNALSPSILPIC